MILMRQLDGRQKPLWASLQGQQQKFLQNEDCDPDLLTGWTDKNLSLWEISSAEGKPVVDDILFALCRGKQDEWDKISYILFSDDAVSLSRLKLTPCNGRTGDSVIDCSGTHYEIRNITGIQLCALVHHISTGKYEIFYFKRKDWFSILLATYDRTKRSEILTGDTSISPTLEIPSSASAAQLPSVQNSEPDDLFENHPISDVEQPPSSSTN